MFYKLTKRFYTSVVKRISQREDVCSILMFNYISVHMQGWAWRWEQYCGVAQFLHKISLIKSQFAKYFWFFTRFYSRKKRQTLFSNLCEISLLDFNHNKFQKGNNRLDLQYNVQSRTESRQKQRKQETSNMIGNLFLYP